MGIDANLDNFCFTAKTIKTFVLFLSIATGFNGSYTTQRADRFPKKYPKVCEGLDILTPVDTVCLDTETSCVTHIGRKAFRNRTCNEICAVGKGRRVCQGAYPFKRHPCDVSKEDQLPCGQNGPGLTCDCGRIIDEHVCSLRPMDFVHAQLGKHVYQIGEPMNRHHSCPLDYTVPDKNITCFDKGLVRYENAAWEVIYIYPEDQLSDFQFCRLDPWCHVANKTESNAYFLKTKFRFNENMIRHLMCRNGGKANFDVNIYCLNKQEMVIEYPNNTSWKGKLDSCYAPNEKIPGVRFNKRVYKYKDNLGKGVSCDFPGMVPIKHNMLCLYNDLIRESLQKLFVEQSFRRKTHTYNKLSDWCEWDLQAMFDHGKNKLLPKDFAPERFIDDYRLYWDDIDGMFGKNGLREVYFSTEKETTGASQSLESINEKTDSSTVPRVTDVPNSTVPRVADAPNSTKRSIFRAKNTTDSKKDGIVPGRDRDGADLKRGEVIFGATLTENGRVFLPEVNKSITLGELSGINFPLYVKLKKARIRRDKGIKGKFVDHALKAAKTVGNITRGKFGGTLEKKQKVNR